MKGFWKEFWSEFKTDVVKTHLWVFFTVVIVLHDLTGMILGDN